MFTSVIAMLHSSQLQKCKFEIDSNSRAFPKQLRYAVKLYSHSLNGSVLLIDAHKWLEVYFTGITEGKDSSYVLKSILHKAILRCAKVLSYDKLEVEFGVLCGCDHCGYEVPKHHPAHIYVSAKQVEATCTEMNELSPVILTDDRYTKWFISEETTCKHDASSTIGMPYMHAIYFNYTMYWYRNCTFINVVCVATINFFILQISLLQSIQQ